MYRNLLELLDFDDIGMLYLEFVVTEDKLGVAETVELVEGGADITVDQVPTPSPSRPPLRAVFCVRSPLPSPRPFHAHTSLTPLSPPPYFHPI